MARTTDTAASLLESPVRRAIVEALSPSPEHAGPALVGESPSPFLGRPHHTAGELADLLDLHVTTVRFHLDQLDAAGILESAFVRTGSAGRPRKVYALAAPVDAAAASDGDAMLILTELLTQTFGATDGSAPITPEAAGRRWAEGHVPATHESPAATWGQWLGKMGHVIDVLQQWGYTPQLTTTTGHTGTRIDLTHCPFRELARANPTVVCGIHKGLIAGTMTQVGEPDSEIDLAPFAEGETCIAHVRPAASERTSPTLNNGTIPVRTTNSRPA